MDKYIPNNSLETNVGKQLQQKAFIIFGLSFETWKLQTSLHNVAFAKQEVSGVYSLFQSTKSSQALEEGSALLPSLSLLIQQAPVILVMFPCPRMAEGAGVVLCDPHIPSSLPVLQNQFYCLANDLLLFPASFRPDRGAAHARLPLASIKLSTEELMGGKW